jgi:hypothetical protein
VYAWAGGVHLNVRLDEEKLCPLVVVGRVLRCRAAVGGVPSRRGARRLDDGEQALDTTAPDTTAPGILLTDTMTAHSPSSSSTLSADTMSGKALRWSWPLPDRPHVRRARDVSPTLYRAERGPGRTPWSQCYQ